MAAEPALAPPGERSWTLGKRLTRPIIEQKRTGSRRARAPARTVVLPEEGELGEPGHVGSLPGPEERRVARRRAGADADVVFGVGLETAAAEQVELLELGEPAADALLALDDRVVF